jgi:glutamyl-tRNA reductase
MRLELIGLNHRTSPLAVREQAAIGGDRLVAVLRDLVGPENVEGAAVLSTCNRTELYLSPLAHHEPGELRALLCRITGVTAGAAEPAYVLRDEAAVRHLIRLAAGLDSQMLGEVQILGQLKAAYEAARDLGTTNGVLNKALLRAIEAGKEARHRTGISQGAVSVASAAVQMSQRIFSTLAGRNVLLVGAGETARLAAKHLEGAGVTSWRVANRTEANARVVADLLGGRVTAYPPGGDDLVWADIVICATGAPQPVLTTAVMAPANRRRRRPQLLLDLAVPRDVEPAVRDLPDTYLYNVDDFQDLVAANLKAREHEAQRAEKIVEKHVEEFSLWYREHRVAPMMEQLQAVLEALRSAEVAKQKHRFPADQHQELDQFSLSLIRKVTNLVAGNLKRASVDRDDLSVARALAQAVAREGDEPAVKDVLKRLDHERSH